MGSVLERGLWAAVRLCTYVCVDMKADSLVEVETFYFPAFSDIKKKLRNLTLQTQECAHSQSFYHLWNTSGTFCVQNAFCDAKPERSIL